MLFQCWPTVFDAGPTFKQHWVNVPCLLGCNQLIPQIPGYMEKDMSTNISQIVAYETSLSDAYAILFAKNRHIDGLITIRGSNPLGEMGVES